MGKKQKLLLSLVGIVEDHIGPIDVLDMLQILQQNQRHGLEEAHMSLQIDVEIEQMTQRKQLQLSVSVIFQKIAQTMIYEIRSLVLDTLRGYIWRVIAKLIFLRALRMSPLNFVVMPKKLKKILLVLGLII